MSASRRGLWPTISSLWPFQQNSLGRNSPVRIDVSPAYDAEVLRLLDLLRSRKDTTVGMIASDGDRPEVVILNGAVTGWRDQAFGGETLLDALAAAADFADAVQGKALANAPADDAGRERLLAMEVELAEYRRIVNRVVDERRRQVHHGRGAVNDDAHVRGELLAFARRLLFLGQCSAEAGPHVIAGHHVRTGDAWWVREATYHALKFVDDPNQLLVHVACALLSEVARRERADRKAGA